MVPNVNVDEYQAMCLVAGVGWGMYVHTSPLASGEVQMGVRRGWCRRTYSTQRSE